MTQTTPQTDRAAAAGGRLSPSSMGVAMPIGRPGATPAAAQQAHAGRGGAQISPQRMQSLLYGTNDPGATPNAKAEASAAVKTRRPSPTRYHTARRGAEAAVALNAAAASPLAASPLGRSGNLAGIGGDGAGGLTAGQANALAAARAAVLAATPPGADDSSAPTTAGAAAAAPAACVELTARERRRMEILKLAQAIHGET